MSIADQRAFPDPPSFERSWSASYISPASAISPHFFLGRTRGGLIVLRDIYLFSTTAVAVSAVAFYTFKPFVLYPDGSLHYIGTPKATNANPIAANTPYRVHQEMALDYHLSRDMAVGVEVATTVTPTGVYQTLIASLDYAA